LALRSIDLPLALCSSVFLEDQEELWLLPYEYARCSSSCKEQKGRKRKTPVRQERLAERQPLNTSMSTRSRIRRTWTRQIRSQALPEGACLHFWSRYKVHYFIVYNISHGFLCFDPMVQIQLLMFLSKSGCPKLLPVLNNSTLYT
jgi:hypothetical protein